MPPPRDRRLLPPLLFLVGVEVVVVVEEDVGWRAELAGKSCVPFVVAVAAAVAAAVSFVVSASKAVDVDSSVNSVLSSSLWSVNLPKASSSSWWLLLSSAACPPAYAADGCDINLLFEPPLLKELRIQPPTLTPFHPSTGRGDAGAAGGEGIGGNDLADRSGRMCGLSTTITTLDLLPVALRELTLDCSTNNKRVMKKLSGIMPCGPMMDDCLWVRFRFRCLSLFDVVVELTTLNNNTTSVSFGCALHYWVALARLVGLRKKVYW